MIAEPEEMAASTEDWCRKILVVFITCNASSQIIDMMILRERISHYHFNFFDSQTRLYVCKWLKSLS